MAYYRQVVGDEQHGQSVLFSQVLHQVKNLRLNGDIKGRYWLVSHYEFGPGGQGATNGNSLALAAGKLVGVLTHKAAGQAHIVH